MKARTAYKRLIGDSFPIHGYVDENLNIWDGY